MDELTGLEQRALAADRGEAAAADPEAAQATAATPDEAQQWVEAVLQLGPMARTVPVPGFDQWTDERLRAFGEALARCAKHYGWTFGGMLSHPLIGLAVAAFPLAWPVAAPYIVPKLKAAQQREEKPVAEIKLTDG